MYNMGTRKAKQHVSFRIDDEKLKEIDADAEKMGITRTSLIHIILYDWMKRKKMKEGGE